MLMVLLNSAGVLVSSLYSLVLQIFISYGEWMCFVDSCWFLQTYLSDGQIFFSYGELTCFVWCFFQLQRSSTFAVDFFWKCWWCCWTPLEFVISCGLFGCYKYLSPNGEWTCFDGFGFCFGFPPTPAELNICRKIGSPWILELLMLLLNSAGVLGSS